MGAYAIRPYTGMCKICPASYFPHPDTPKTHPISPPDKDTPKTRPVLGANPRRGLFRGVCNTPRNGYVKNPSDFTFSNKDTPKTRPVLGLNLWRGTFSERMQYAPTRVRAKFVQFHISAHEYNKNTPYFTFPHTDTPKTYPISPSQIRIHPKPARF